LTQNQQVVAAYYMHIPQRLALKLALGKGADENKMKPVSHVANLFGLIFKVNAPVGTQVCRWLIRAGTKKI